MEISIVFIKINIDFIVFLGEAKIVIELTCYVLKHSHTQQWPPRDTSRQRSHVSSTYQGNCSTLTSATSWAETRSPCRPPWSWARRWWKQWAGPTLNTSTTSRSTATLPSWLSDGRQLPLASVPCPHGRPWHDSYGCNIFKHKIFITILNHVITDFFNKIFLGLPCWNYVCCCFV